MKTILRTLVAVAIFPVLAFAVYAPIPEQEQGKAMSYRLGASSYYDSNIFGAAANEISSMVYNFNGEISFNGSLDDQTFSSGAYELNNDYFVDRPGRKNLTSHGWSGRIAHSFAADTSLDVSGAYNITKNPQSLLAGVPLNIDQSYKRAQLDARYTTNIGPKTGIVAKYRYLSYAYDTGTLAADLDRAENLFGLEGNYAYLPETKLVAEYRYQTIGYDSFSALKNKKSHFLMAGFEYNPGKQLMVSARAGLEDRHRRTGANATAPYVELITRYAYAQGSFLAAGYTYTIEEPSDTDRFTDSNVNRLFVNVQHQLTGAITASGSITYEPSRLQGRGGVQVDINETTTRLGLALSWRPDKNWTVSGTYDYDDVNSDDPNRGQNRERVGVSARFTF